MRGATIQWPVGTPTTTRFNPRPSCEGRLDGKTVYSSSTSFNPRPSCEGRRLLLTKIAVENSFNPRPSCEGRLNWIDNGVTIARFNPRPSCEGRPQATSNTQSHTRFNPRPSCEGRQLDVAKLSTSHTRYSTGFYKVSLRNPLLCNCHGAIEPKKCEPYVSLMTA